MTAEPLANSTTQVAPGVYAYIQPDGTWMINNTAFLVGSQGVVSIDTCSTEARTRDYLDAIRAISPTPVRTVVNTHHHGDHTNGNCLVPGATIIAHRETRATMLRHGLQLDQMNTVWGDVPWGNLDFEPPFVTFDDGITIHVDELECRVEYVGSPAHTTNDSYVWIPEHRVLVSGDLLFHKGTPFLLEGSIQGSIDVLENRLKPLGAETIVPGHGPVCGPELIDDVLAYVRYIQEIAQQGHSAGLPPLEAARKYGPGAFAHLTDDERIVGNLHRAYAELDDHPLGSQIDIPAAILDMVIYNGGKQLRCIA